MRNLVAEAAQNPEASRIALQELNFAVYSEKLLPKAIEGEFESLFEALKDSVSSK